MSKKFETIVNEQNKLLKATAVSKYINSVVAGQDPVVNTVWYGGQQGPNESDFKYAMRLFMRGDMKALQKFKKFDPTAIPVLLDLQTRYGDISKIKDKVDKEAEPYGKYGNVPTLARFNSINYKTPTDQPTHQTAFVAECLSNIDKSHLTSGKQSEATPSTGRFWAGAVNESGVLIQFQKDFDEGIKSATDKILVLKLIETPKDILTNDIENYNHTADSFISGFYTRINIELSPNGNADMSDMLNFIYSNFFDSGTKKPLSSNTTSGDPPIADQSGAKPIFQDPSVQNYINRNFRLPAGDAIREIYVKFVEKILNTATTGEELYNVIQLLKSGTNEAKRACLGVPAYPTNKFNRNLLIQQYYSALPAVLKGIGLSGIEDTLYFVPEAEMDTLRQFLSHRLARQGAAWAVDKVSSVVKNAITHPIQTLNKGDYSFGSMMNNTISS